MCPRARYDESVKSRNGIHICGQLGHIKFCTNYEVV